LENLKGGGWLRPNFSLGWLELGQIIPSKQKGWFGIKVKVKIGFPISLGFPLWVGLKGFGLYLEPLGRGTRPLFLGKV